MFIRIWPTEKLLYLPIDSKQWENISQKVGKLTAFLHPAHSNEGRNKTDNMTLSSKSLAGPGYVILNGIRVMNVIGLMAVVTASIVMLVKTSVSSKFFFFDAVTHVLTAITSMFLLASELSLFRGYYARNWPLLGPSHGFVALSLAMIVLGINMLGNLNKEATSQESLGLSFWRIVIASGCMIFILGWVNLLASFLFRDRSKNITARQVRAKGAVAIHKTDMPHSSSASASHSDRYISTPSPKTYSPLRLFHTPPPNRSSILPSYATTASPPYPPTAAPLSPTSKYSRTTDCPKKTLWNTFRRSARHSLAPPLPVNPHKSVEISGPMGVNPQFAHLVHVQRPDSAFHPSRGGEAETFRWRS